MASDNVKSTLKQRCVCQRRSLQRQINVEQRQINVVNFNVDVNSVRQPRNNAVILNAEFHNVDQCRNNVVNMTFSKKLKRAKKHF